MSQNGNQSQKKEWTFTFYDNQGRLSLTGLCSFNDPPSLDNSIVRAYRTTAEKDGVLHSGYEVEHFPYTLSSLLQVNYYDDYNFTTDTQLAFGLEKIGKVQYDSLYINHEASLISAQGRLTGTKIKVLDKEQYLTSALYYDYKGRIIQGRCQNHLGGYDTDFYSYTYTGKLFARLHTYQIGNGKRHMEEYTYEYLADGELRDVYHRVDNAYRANHLLYYTYDNARRVFLKDVGGLGAYTIYTYDVRDQVTKTMCRFFLSEEISYNASQGVPCYNGNISSIAWRSEEDDTDGISKGYRFAYDSMNRMTDARYGEGENLTGNLNRYDEQVTSFDKNGNILGLRRCGAIGPENFGVIDSLYLSYQGNHLLNVTDYAKNDVYGSSTNFRDGIRSSAEYAYDLNGNLIQDLNKGIARIRYNCLNLPSAIEFTDGRTISYLYSADGTKLEVIHAMGDSITTTDYCGKAIYENGKLDKILLDGEGFVSFADDVSYSYHFFLKDYLGNVRVVYNEDREAEEVNHYYPFGGILASSTGSVQPYKYNGKELDRKGGLDWYDYGARMYDPVLGRWHVVDPSSEKYYGVSPYNYCANNPVKYIDPDGKDWYKVQNEEGIWKYSYSADIHSQKDLNKVVRNGMYLGVTHTENNIYYSLFGSKKVADSFEGAVYQKIDNAILTSAIAEKNVNNSFGGEDTGNPTTDFSIEGINSKESRYLGLDTHRNEYNIEYEGSSSGLYNVLGGKGAMKGYMENWVGDRDMPKDIGGWQNGQKAFHIRFMNKKGVDILHLKYSKSAANTLVDKYNRLFFNREK